ncbi:hypothetical protein [Herpetosiphon geysericola]|uniref:Uncharacterized protein n=1 Tax=Herpetosiphon geysericola TaxID=70996 RepID=A0A0P6YMQ2_9CHLR|nr:hypothetical protein [Herpetosiphon geysericola]KPL91932.1 hypothetical protein SE18_00850 [Herpetosiphon geysericola]
MEIKPLLIGLGTPQRLGLHFVELDFREQRVLVHIRIKDRWLQVDHFDCWFNRATLKRFAEQLRPWLTLRTHDAELNSDFAYMEINNFSLKLQVQGRSGDIQVVYALSSADHARIEAAGDFAFNNDFLLQLIDETQHINELFDQIWNDPALLAAYPESYPLFEPFD